MLASRQPKPVLWPRAKWGAKALCDRNAYYLIDARKSNKRKRDTAGEETTQTWNAELLLGTATSLVHQESPSKAAGWRPSRPARSAIYQQGLRHYHSKKIKPLALREGDLVLRLLQEQAGQHKLSPPWEGPFIVSRALPRQASCRVSE